MRNQFLVALLFVPAAACTVASRDAQSDSARPQVVQTTATPDTARAAPTQASASVVPPCAVLVVVTFRAAALTGPNPDSALRTLSGRTLDAMKRDVAKIDYSPAIRAIRVHAADTASASRLLAALRRAPEVETAERDDCSAHLQRP